jgi:mono/diheme cytochrome c family protein
MTRTCPTIAFIALGAMLSLKASAGPFDTKDVQAGRELSLKMCSSCHAMPSQSSKEPALSLTGAPFPEIAKGSKATHENLRVFLLSTHSNIAHPGGMPRLELTETQIWQIAAYLSSLRNEQEQKTPK